MEYLFFLGFILSIGIGFGIISSTPLGPINLLVAENYLSVKKVKIVPFIFGVILIDSIFGYLTFWGFDKFLSDYKLVGTGIGVFGGLAIISLGIIGVYQQIKGKHNPNKKIEIKKSIFLKSSTASFTKGFILCGSNPGFIAFWGWVAYNAKTWTGDAFPTFDINYFNLLLFPLGIIIGDTIWFGVFTLLLKKGARRYSGSLIDKIRLFISWGLVALGIFTLYASISPNDKMPLKVYIEQSKKKTDFAHLNKETIHQIPLYTSFKEENIYDFKIELEKESIKST